MRKLKIPIIVLTILLSGTALAGDFYESDLKYPISSKSKEDLENWFAKRSFGTTHTQNIALRKAEVFLVETFPYSGIRASHIYLYRKTKDAYDFLVYYWLASGERVILIADTKTNEVVVQTPTGKSVLKLSVGE